MIAPWLKRHLEATGRWNADGISRRLRARRCRDCQTMVLAGLDADQCAFATFVDPAPISALGEALAVLADRHTYDLRRVGPQFELDHRCALNISKRPADGTRDVHASHRCGASPLPDLPSAYDFAADRQETPHEPPF